MATWSAESRRQAIWGIAAVAWMATIFVLSSYADSDFTGGRRLHFGIYKLAHLIEFTVLGLLVAGATRRLPSRAVWWAWVIAVLFAISDEVHQAFVPGRSPLVTDVAIDSLGGLLGIVAYGVPNSIREGRTPLSFFRRPRPPARGRMTQDADPMEKLS